MATTSFNSANWYFICRSCTAKWFADAPRLRCPRCGTPAESNEMLIAPWHASGNRTPLTPDPAAPSSAEAEATAPHSGCG